MAMDGARMRGSIVAQIARERARRCGDYPSRESVDRPLAEARRLATDLSVYDALSAAGVSRPAAKRAAKPPLPKALLAALQATKRSARNAAGEARRGRVRQFPLLVVGDKISAQLERFQLIRERPNADGPPSADCVWKDATNEARAEHVEHRQFGGAIRDFNDFAKAMGYKFRRVRGAVQVGYWNNPNAKWERWEIGGRYAGRLRVVWSDQPLDQARFGDLDFAGMRSGMRRRAEGVYNRARRNPNEARALGVDLSLTRAEYVLLRLNRHPLLSAAICKEGAWFDAKIEPSRLVYDDVWSRTFEALIADISTTTLVTMVDCQL